MSDSESDASDSPREKKRSLPITTAGRELLIGLVKKYKSTVESKKSDFITLNKKRQTWETISQEFSSQLGDQRRTGDQLKKTWDNLKTKAKKDVLNHKKRVKKTGGGRKPADIPFSSQQVIQIIPDQMFPLENEFDCDATHFVIVDDSMPATTKPINLNNTNQSCVDLTSNLELLTVPEARPCNSVSHETPGGRSLRTKKDPRSSLLDMEYEEHKIRLSTLAVVQQFKRDKNKRKREMMEETHLARMEVYLAKSP